MVSRLSEENEQEIENFGNYCQELLVTSSF
jgi:hypothetical protein